MTAQQSKAAIWLGAWLLRLLACTIRFRVLDRSGLVGQPVKDPVIWMFWHNTLLLIPILRLKFLPQREGCALASASKDGELVAMFLKEFGVHTARGSNSRRAVAGLVALKRAAKEGLDPGLTPDGPRGPIYVMNGGIITLAQITDLPLFPIHIHVSRAWRLRSWDRFIIPKPFSTVTYHLGELVPIPRTSTPEDFESERARVERIMRDGLPPGEWNGEVKSEK